MKTTLAGAVASILVFIVLAFGLTAVLLQPEVACSEEAWVKEFDAVCSQTGDAMDMTKDQLKQLIGRCNKLQSEIEKQDEITRKVYLKRLKSCRELYEFVLNTKDKQ
ncbi:MAG TPA: hypothetical protein VMB78_06190 [Dissulfurispiraceae bacterium]|nr:hypothetical protein [Dissulfurispiraceae bacterium]